MLSRILFVGTAVLTSGFGMVLMAYPRAAAPQPELQRTAMVVSSPGRGDRLIMPEVAATPVEREIGLAGRKPGGEVHGMYFEIPSDGGGNIDTTDIGAPVDVVVLDGAGTVLSVRKGVRPGEPVDYGRNARAYLLMQKGAARQAGFGLGSVLRPLAPDGQAGVAAFKIHRDPVIDRRHGNAEQDRLGSRRS